MRFKKKTSPRKHSPGFTLVEMLVAVALVLLMMSLFAQVFQLAGGTITTQRGIAENDQRSRTFQNVIKADLDKRTFRVVMPWAVGEDGSLAEVDAIRREGYFYISENDPLNDLDDEIQFTMNVNALTKNFDTSAYFGKATTSSGWTTTDTSQTPNVTYLNFANQPEADDGWTTPNGTAEAPAAEVAYFVRGGKLYRRILLIRKPLPLSGANSQPTFNDGRDAFDYTVTVPPGGQSPYPDPTLVSGVSFWNDFDHSAFRQPGFSAVGPVARFHSVDDLSNASTLTQFPLGNPKWRFGHRIDNGRSREFDSSGNYFGRFMHEETSNFNFRYPQGESTLGDPMTATINLDV
ncbi:MAG: type II secretion system protein, partial [Planctomycetaceae bacterium]|nr:type II secretion system protein [Planctomycetaceae bacterium]